MHFIIISVIIALLLIYFIAFLFLRKKVAKVENAIISTFLLKTAKIPGLIEIMRNFVADERVFETITKIHSQTIIHEYESIYILLEHNTRIHGEFAFLMKLAMQIPDLQTNSQFIYIREFIMLYEKNIKNSFSAYNSVVKKWNRFVTIKNATIIGFLLPGKKKEYI